MSEQVDTSKLEQWNIAAKYLPGGGVIVTTISEGGQQRDLQYRGGLWLHPDGTRCDYCAVKFWRTKENAEV